MLSLGFLTMSRPTTTIMTVTGPGGIRIETDPDKASQDLSLVRDFRFAPASAASGQAGIVPRATNVTRLLRAAIVSTEDVGTPCLLHLELSQKRLRDCTHQCLATRRGPRSWPSFQAPLQPNAHDGRPQTMSAGGVVPAPLPPPDISKERQSPTRLWTSQEDFS